MFAIHFDTCFINETIGSQTNNYHKRLTRCEFIWTAKLCTLFCKNKKLILHKTNNYASRINNWI